MKSKMAAICIVGITIGMYMSRSVGQYFGMSGKIVTGISGLVVALIGLMILLFTKHYTVALISFFMLIPVAISIIGIYQDNVYFVIGGIIGLVAFIKILPQFIKKLK